MKKVERLNWITDQFGQEFVLPFKVCSSWREIESAVWDFEKKSVSWGMRTDTPHNSSIYPTLPFVLHGSLESVRDVWDRFAKSLIYIICHNITRYRCNAVVLRLDDEHVFFEFNPVDKHLSQRNMYDQISNLRYLSVGPVRRLFLQQEYRYPFRPLGPVYCRDDHLIQDLRFHKIYDLMMRHPCVNEITFSVRSPDGKIVIW